MTGMPHLSDVRGWSLLALVPLFLAGACSSDPPNVVVEPAPTTPSEQAASPAANSNFVFDLDTEDLGAFGSPPFETAVAVITLSRTAPPALESRPAFIDAVENRPRPATADEATRILGVLKMSE